MFDMFCLQVSAETAEKPNICLLIVCTDDVKHTPSSVFANKISEAAWAEKSTHTLTSIGVALLDLIITQSQSLK